MQLTAIPPTFLRPIHIVLIAANLILVAASAFADGRAEYHLCKASMDQSDWPAAIANCTAALNGGIDDDFAAMALAMRAYAYSRTGDQDRGLADVNRAIALRPRFALGYDLRGKIETLRHDDKSALDDFSKAIALRPDFRSPYLERGSLEIGLNLQNEAIRDFSTAIDLNPDAAEGYLGRGYAHYQLGNEDDAIADYDKAIAIDASDVRAYAYRARAYSGTGAYDLALMDVNTAIRLEPGNGEHGRDKANVLFYLGRFAEAANLGAEYLKQNPTDAYTLLLLVVARGRASYDTKTVLDRGITAIDLSKWPGPVLQFFAGSIDSDEVDQSAIGADTQTTDNQKCEAAFYIGERALIAGDMATALERLATARDRCPKNYFEQRAAAAESRRLP